MDYVLHEQPSEFQREGAVINSCPSCAGKAIELSDEKRDKLRLFRLIAELLGDDVDGFAAEIEDLGLLK